MPEIGAPHKLTHQDGGNDEINATGLVGVHALDDTPVNGETDKGITSNWAYDEDVTLRALIEAALPWTIHINPFPTPKSNINWDTISVDTGQIGGGSKSSTNALNNEITWDIVLGAGTWTVEILYIQAGYVGIISIQFDSVEKGTIDTFLGPGTYNNRASVSSINVPLTKKIELKLKVTGKNAGSTGYNAYISIVTLIRTA